MSTAANHTTRASHSSSVPAVGETSYLRCPEGRIGYDVAGVGPLVVLVPGLGDLRAGYRFLAPALRAAGYRVACTDLHGHGDGAIGCRGPPGRSFWPAFPRPITPRTAHDRQESGPHRARHRRPQHVGPADIPE